MGNRTTGKGKIRRDILSKKISLSMSDNLP